MSYIPHEWKDGDLITAERLNHLENGAGQAAQPGPRGETGDTGPAGPKGETGQAGAGLTGTAVVLKTLTTEADAATVLEKVNELIGILNTRGVSNASSGS